MPTVQFPVQKLIKAPMPFCPRQRKYFGSLVLARSNMAMGCGGLLTCAQQTKLSRAEADGERRRGGHTKLVLQNTRFWTRLFSDTFISQTSLISFQELVRSV